MHLKNSVDADGFLYLAEIEPPKGVDVTRMLDCALKVKGRIDAFIIPEMSSAVMRMSSLGASMLLKGKGLEVVMQLCGRDRNRLALQADILSAYACGVKSLMVVKGDITDLGDHNKARQVNDVSASEILQCIKGLEKGRDMAGIEISGNPNFSLISTLNISPPIDLVDAELKETDIKVEIGVNYAVIINSNAGLWGYSIGDTVKFVNKDPYRLIVTGRIKHFISAFGEHVIGEEVEKAMKHAIEVFKEVETIEFTVAPQVTPGEGLPLHEWYVEFSKVPADMDKFEKVIDEKLQQLNSYYEDLITGKILRPLKIIPLQKDAFRNYMKSKGKLGGQNKVPRLSNDRQIADELRTYQ